MKIKVKETPLMAQYNRIKAKYPENILLFRVGDIYETFGNDAIILSTKKNNGLVEIEASNDNNVLTSFPRNNQEKKHNCLWYRNKS